MVRKQKSVEKSAAKARQSITRSRRCVVKLGSALLTDLSTGIDHSLIARISSQIASLLKQGMEVVLVSSGSVAEGMQRLGWQQRPHEVYRLQAAAAMGQMGLIQTYESAFKQHDLHTAQLLLTHADLAHRQRYLNARSTLRTLLELGVVPVINENDTVVTDEIRFGDNDMLAALVANLVEADLLVLLTDQDGLMDADPRLNPNACLIKHAVVGDKTLEAVAGSGNNLGRGGMLTKIRAAALAARSGTETIIANGNTTDVLIRLLAGEDLGTHFSAGTSRLAARKQWLAGQLQVQGRLTLDVGAVKVLKQSGRSLLAVGITAISGDFDRGALVVCVDEEQNEVARGLVNYSAKESKKIMGLASTQIEQVLGYVDEPELIHRDNMVLLN